MNLGDKIKKYRVLRGLTQTKLGEMVGFSRTTANSRIRKYETNEMAPKADIRQKLSDALNVDMSALSDIDVQSEEDIMQVLFLLEETQDMEIVRDGNKISLTFDCESNRNPKLMGYLCNWASTKDTTSDDADSQKQYEDWKAQFPKDINSFLIEQITELNNIYNPLVKKYASKAKKLKDMTDFMVLIRNMMETGIQIEAEHKSWQTMGDGGIILNFKAAQLTDTDNQHAVKAFTDFLCGINTISDFLAEPFKPTAFITAKGTIISYPLRYSPFSGFQRYINEIQKYMDSKPHTDWEEKNFNSAFKLNGENWELIRFK